MAPKRTEQGHGAASVGDEAEGSLEGAGRGVDEDGDLVAAVEAGRGEGRGGRVSAQAVAWRVAASARWRSSASGSVCGARKLPIARCGRRISA